MTVRPSSASSPARPASPSSATPSRSSSLGLPIATRRPATVASTPWPATPEKRRHVRSYRGWTCQLRQPRRSAPLCLGRRAGLSKTAARAPTELRPLPCRVRSVSGRAACIPRARRRPTATRARRPHARPAKGCVVELPARRPAPGRLSQSRSVAHAEEHLLRLIADLLKEAKRGGALRSDVPVSELARYCLQALSAAAALPSRAAVLRLVAVTLDGLRAQP